MKPKGQDHSVTRREIQQTFGFAPKFFEAVPDATLDQQWALMRDFGLAETNIPGKYKELIGLAVGAHIKCKYCIHYHTQAARLHGATDEELREACFMGGYTAQWSNTVTGAQVDFDQFRQDVDRAVDHLRTHPGAPAHH